MLNHEKLYEGFSREQAIEYHNEATRKWGDAVTRSERHLKKLSREEFQQLKLDADVNWKKLSSMCEMEPSDPEVQKAIEHDYLITRKFCGTANSNDPQLDAYVGLGQLYVEDGRYTMVDGKENPKFAGFMRDAMRMFVDKRR